MQKTRLLRSRLASAAVVAALAIVLTACGKAKPLDYTQTGEIPPGPGLFSGDDGRFVVFRK